MLRTIGLLCLCTVSAVIAATAQTDPGNVSGTPPQVTAPAYDYCELIAEGDMPRRSKTPVVVDYGQAQNSAWQYNFVRDENGDKILFFSIVDAYNHMAREGWEFVQAYCTGEDNNRVHYVLKRQHPQ